MNSFKDYIIHEDDNFIFINKPYGVSSLDERSGHGNSILKMAREYAGDIQLCHRLDKETSGMLAIAKNPEAYRHMSIQFEKREVEKVYHAVVNGVHSIESIMVNLPILPLPDGIVKIDRAKGKPATTYFNTIKAFKNATLVECRPVTGRMHQIRIHLSCLKAPIVSDSQYGGKEVFLSEVKRKFNLKKDTEEQPLIRRVALHAYALTYTDMDGESKQLVAPYPKDFAVLVKQLEINS